MKKVVRIIVKIFIVILVIALGVYGFTKVYPSFGASPSAKMRKDYQKRASNFDGKSFHNTGSFKLMEAPGKGKKNHFVSKKGATPEKRLTALKPDLLSGEALKKSKDFSVTWFGHSTLLIQMHGMNILIDPIFSERSSPFQFVGTKRFSDLPMTIKQLPKIDVVLFSHDHMDYLDYDTIVQLDHKVKRYVVPLGIESDLERWHVSSKKITNMAWWEETKVDGLTIGCTPARHYSGRGRDDRYKTLWCSWVLKDADHQIYESGDTGYGSHFKEIHKKYGDFDFALVDCAQYDALWPDVHMFPEQAFKAVEELGAKQAMPIHFGTFKLANHPWDDPVVRFVNAAKGSDVTISTPRIGETMVLSKIKNYQHRWYESIK